MSSIINCIIEIDSIAQKRLNDAHVIEQGIKQQIIEKNEQTARVISEKAEARIAKMDEIEQQYAQEEMTRINELCAEQLQNLEKVYETSHQKLEDDLYNRVIVG